MIAKVNIIIKKSFTNFLKINKLRLYISADWKQFLMTVVFCRDAIYWFLTNWTIQYIFYLIVLTINH